jgi:tRNA(fMet)-specific endonuclease VapC
MNVLFDTNIILSIIRAKRLNEIMAFFNPLNKSIFCSVVTEAESKVIAIKNKWAEDKTSKLDYILQQITVIEVNQSLVSTYVAIDSYSDRLNPNFSTYPFDTPRNMGKNDLWISSTASLLGLQLVTTDQDFDHLDGIFIDLRRIEPVDLKQYFK